MIYYNFDDLRWRLSAMRTSNCGSICDKAGLVSCSIFNLFRLLFFIDTSTENSFSYRYVAANGIKLI